MGRNGWVVVGAAVAIVAAYASWTAFLSPEARASRVVKEAGAAAEAVDVERFLGVLDDGYSDFLHEDRAGLEARLREGFARVDRLNVTLQDLTVEVEGDSATARFDLVVIAFRGEERYVAVGTPFQPEPMLVELRRGAEGFKIRRVDRRVPGESP